MPIKINSKQWVVRLLLISLLGCSPRVAYKGPQLDSSQVSKVYFYSNELEISRLRVDEVEQGIFNMGLEVAPGTHRAEVDFKISENDCDALLFLCTETTQRGICRVEFQSHAGKDYDVRVSGTVAEGRIRVEDPISKEVRGLGVCEVQAITRQVIHSERERYN